MKVAILGTFGASASGATGPVRVSRALTAALLEAGVVADLYELRVPRGWVARCTSAQETECRVLNLPPVRLVSPRMAGRLASRGYALIHFVGTLGLYSLPLLRRLSRRGIPSVATLNGLFVLERPLGFPYSPAEVWAERRALPRVAQLVAVSRRFAEAVEHTYPSVAGRVAAIPHGWDGCDQRREDDVTAPRVRSGLLALGGTGRVKGMGFLLAAVEQLMARGFNVDLSIGGPAGSDHETVLSAIARLGPGVRYIGEVEPPNVPVLCTQCAVYLQPSVTETFGLAALEAMAAGAPVVVTRQCGMAELVEDGVSGFVVDYGDVPALADRLARLLRDPQLAVSMGRAACAAAREWTWAKAARRYKAIYEAVASAAWQ